MSAFAELPKNVFFGDENEELSEMCIEAHERGDEEEDPNEFEYED